MAVPSLEDVGNFMSDIKNFVTENKDAINMGVDFIPIVGGINRLVQGDIKEGLINLALDATGPFKYLAKGAKIAKLAVNSSKIAKATNKVKKLEKELELTNTIEKGRKLNKEIKATTNTINHLNRANNVIVKNSLRKSIKHGIPQKLAVDGVSEIPFTDDDLVRFSTTARGIGNVKAGANANYLLDILRYKDQEPNYNDPGNAFLLSDDSQEKYLNNLGYVKTNDEDGIKKIQKAVNALKEFRGNDKLNIYQIGEDEIPRDSVIPIEEKDVPINYKRRSLANDAAPIQDSQYGIYLGHAGNHPTIYYKHINPDKEEYYYRDIDLNDYGNHKNTGGVGYYDFDNLANLYDLLGNPFVRKTGILKMIEDKENNN